MFTRSNFFDGLRKTLLLSWSGNLRRILIWEGLSKGLCRLSERWLVLLNFVEIIQIRILHLLTPSEEIYAVTTLADGSCRTYAMPTWRSCRSPLDLSLVSWLDQAMIKPPIKPEWRTKTVWLAVGSSVHYHSTFRTPVPYHYGTPCTAVTRVRDLPGTRWNEPGVGAPSHLIGIDSPGRHFISSHTCDLCSTVNPLGRLTKSLGPQAHPAVAKR